MTTVGYGDQYPTWTTGKVIAFVTMFTGIMIIALPVAIVSSKF